MVQKSSRDKVCTNCKKKKKACSIKGVVGRLIAAGELATVGEAMNLKIRSREDIVALGLDRGSELVLIQLHSFQQEFSERLRMIEDLLRAGNNDRMVEDA